MHKHNPMIEYLQFRAKGISFYKGWINSQPHTLIKLSNLNQQSLSLLQALSAKQPRHFLDLTNRISINSQQYLVAPILRLYEPLERLTQSQLLTLLIKIVDLYLELNSIITGLFGRKHNWHQMAISPDSLFVDRSKDVVVFDLDVPTSKDMSINQQLKQVLYYLSNSTEGNFKYLYPELMSVTGVESLIEAKRFLKGLVIKSEQKMMARSLGGVTLRVKTENQDKEEVVVKRCYSISKIHHKKNSLIKDREQSHRPKQSCILQPFLRQHLPTNQSNPEPKLKKTSSRRRVHPNTNMFNLSHSKILTLSTKTRPLNIQINSSMRTSFLNSSRPRISHKPQSILKNQIEDIENIRKQPDDAIAIEDIMIDHLETVRNTKHADKSQQNVSSRALEEICLDEIKNRVEEGQQVQNQTDRKILGLESVNHCDFKVTENSVVNNSIQPTDQSTGLGIIQAIIDRYNLIGQLVSNSKKHFDKRLNWKTAIFLLYKKFIQLRVCLLGCLQDRDNAFGIADWPIVSTSAAYRILMQKLTEQNQQIIRAAQDMRSTLKQNDISPEMLSLSEHNPDFDKILFQWNYNLYMNLKQLVVDERRKPSMPFLCNYLTCLAICQDIPMDVVSEKAGIAELAAFMDKAEGKFNTINTAYLSQKI